MCGIAGIWDLAGELVSDELGRIATGMTRSLAHRGPDGEGIAVLADGPALGHRRLAVLGLGPEGQQPMLGPEGRYAITYNGEIYNYREIRRELEAEGLRFRGGSDTEVLVAALECWGPAVTLARIDGMFAFAAWDRVERVLHLARDRLGKKPLYLWRAGQRIAFSSELKAFRACPGFVPRLNQAALRLYLHYGFIPAPATIYEDCLKLPPATTLRLPADARPAEVDLTAPPFSRRYWSLAEIAASAAEGQAPPRREGELLDELEHLLEAAVTRRTLAEVPLGAFLSGGIDSSLVVAVLRRAAGGPIRTFTARFTAPEYDEADHAAVVARHLGTDHAELTITPEEALSLVPRLPELFDEPFGDASAIPSYLIARRARAEVTVALTGDGGDEAFCGYTRHVWLPALRQWMAYLPAWVRLALGRTIEHGPPFWWYWAACCAGALKGGTVPPDPGTHLCKLAASLAARSVAESYYAAVATGLQAGRVLLAGAEGPNAAHPAAGLPEVEMPDTAAQLALLDYLFYLPEDVLVKIDRASMACGLELRSPFLDRAVVEFAVALPSSIKLAGGQGKHLLQVLLARHLPPALFDRPKRGFNVPLAAWLRGPLRGWAEGLLVEDRLRAEGILAPDLVRGLWTQHLAGTRSWEHQLWNLLVFQQWRERWA
jgi:asparagine synthase (glutamine-hydrolysing)